MLVWTTATSVKIANTIRCHGIVQIVDMVIHTLHQGNDNAKIDGKDRNTEGRG